jgi:surfeit locus 1 family protein
MLHRLRQARLLWPTLLALAGLAVLISLGTWQLERKAWKEGLLAKIAARVGAAPVPISAVTQTQPPGADFEYLHVAATGRFLHDKERYLYAPSPAGLAWHVYTPLELGPGLVVWVNRGSVPDARKAPATRAQGQGEGSTEVRGVVRLVPAPTMFTPANDAAGNLWYWPDIPAMTASAFPDGSVRAMGGLFVEADAEPAPPGGLPRGGVTRISLPNRHLEYALTWYGLALTLIGVFLAFAISRLAVAPNG